MKITNYSFLIILLLSLSVMSCDKDNNKDPDNTCNVSNPAEELDWLKASIDDIVQDDDEFSKYSYYMTATYKGETVFYHGTCHPTINYVSFVRNCNGETLGDKNDLFQELTEEKLLWKHENTKCNFDHL